MTISKTTLSSDIWGEFYDRIKSNVTSVNISISPGSQTVQTYASSYSDVDFSSKSNFPIIVVNSPRIPHEQFTFGKTNVNATIDIEVFATNSQAVDKFHDAINESIETYKSSLADLGIQNLNLEDTDDDFVEHGNIKVHMRRSRFRFTFKFDRTRAY